jgi:hypothetical protein
LAIVLIITPVLVKMYLEMKTIEVKIEKKLSELEKDK